MGAEYSLKLPVRPLRIFSFSARIRLSSSIALSQKVHLTAFFCPGKPSQSYLFLFSSEYHNSRAIKFLATPVSSVYRRGGCDQRPGWLLRYFLDASPYFPPQYPNLIPQMGEVSEDISSYWASFQHNLSESALWLLCFFQWRQFCWDNLDEWIHGAWCPCIP